MSSRIDNVFLRVLREYTKSICNIHMAKQVGNSTSVSDPPRFWTDSPTSESIIVDNPAGCNLIRVIQEDVVYDMERFVEDYLESSKEML